MGHIRNLVIFVAFSLLVSACGGGNTTITDTALSSSSTNGGNSGSNSNTSGNSVSIGSATLKWTAPTTLADGSPVSLSDISGYVIYYGPTATNTPNAIKITDGTETQLTVNLPSGTYYFVISAVDSSGDQGLRSTATQKTI